MGNVVLPVDPILGFVEPQLFHLRISQLPFLDPLNDQCSVLWLLRKAAIDDLHEEVHHDKRGKPHGTADLPSGRSKLPKSLTSCVQNNPS